MTQNTPDTDKTAENAVEQKKTGRPATQVTATLEDQATFDAFVLARRAAGIESNSEAVRTAVDEYVANHAEQTAKAVEFFGW